MKILEIQEFFWLVEYDEEAKKFMSWMKSNLGHKYHGGTPTFGSFTSPDGSKIQCLVFPVDSHYLCPLDFFKLWVELKHT